MTACEEDDFDIDPETGDLIPIIKFENIPKDLNWREQANKYPPPGWRSTFIEYSHDLDHAQKMMNERGYNNFFCPYNHLMFRSLWLTPACEVRVVIFGQDPYTKFSDATGAAFSTWGSVTPSLRNIFKEINNSYPDYHPPKGGDLTHWTQQGVLLLNYCFTVTPPKKPGDKEISHGSIWIPFIRALVKKIIEVNPKTIFVLWGAKARNNLTGVIGEYDNILTAAHPSPKSAYSGFLGCGHFKTINEMLTGYGQKPIQW